MLTDEEQLARLREIVIAVFGPGPDVDHIARWLINSPPFTGDFAAWLAAGTEATGTEPLPVPVKQERSGRG